MELGDEPEVKTAAKLAQMMAYQNKNMLQARPPLDRPLWSLLICVDDDAFAGTVL